MKKHAKLLGALAIFILLCVCAVLISRSSETLSDYARREPEIALRKSEDIKDAAEPPQTSTARSNSDKPSQTPNAGSGSNKPSQTPNAGSGSDEPSQAPAASSDTQTLSQTISADADTENGEIAMNKTVPETENGKVIYQPEFYYESLSEDLKKRITGLSYKEDCPIPYDDLRHVGVLYVNFKGNVSSGDIICNKAIAQDLVEIFYELYQADYQIEQIRLVDEYGADDELSMRDNNTSCFNYRTIAGTDKISMHGRGLAIDINPFFNPYVTYRDGSQHVSPAGAEAYVDRSQPFAYKIDENDLCYKLFLAHGFSWGGNWNSLKDYQHFEKEIDD